MPLKSFLRKRWLLLTAFGVLALPVICLALAILWGEFNPTGSVGIHSFPLYSGATELAITDGAPALGITAGKMTSNPDSFLQYKVNAVPQDVFRFYDGWLLAHGWSLQPSPSPNSSTQPPRTYVRKWTVQHLTTRNGLNVTMSTDLHWLLQYASSFLSLSEEQGTDLVEVSSWFADPSSNYVGLKLIEQPDR